MATSTTLSVQQERVALGRLWWVTLLAIAAASAANLVVYVIATALFEGPRRFTLLGPITIVVSTAVYLVVAAIVYALIGRFARRPIRLFRRVSVVALLLSLLLPISAAITLPAPDAPDAPTVVTLIVMHIIAAILTVGLFTTLARVTGDTNRESRIEI
ncbi:MAG: DUF6069 family protein [Roseiflexaceae bacterium]